MQQVLGFGGEQANRFDVTLQSFSAERRLDARLLAEYEQELAALFHAPQAHSLETVIALAALPQNIRGYGHVREASAAAAAEERITLRAPR